jgi:cation transport ATPase
MAQSLFSLNRPLTADEMVARRRSLVRLGLAWLAMMQVMMFALPGYLRRDAYGHDNLEVLDWAIFLLNWMSLALTIPVILYSAWPVWKGTLRAWQERHVTMDVPVSVSIVAAFIPSAWATWQGQGEVYFDSVTMFVAFLLTARFFEMRARQSVDINHLAELVSRLRAPLMQRADRIALWFVVIQLSIALLVAGYWWAIESAYALPIMVSLLVMSCPCALALSAPVSLAAAQASMAANPDMTERELEQLCASTRRVTHQNLYGSVIFHLVTTPLAAIGVVTPWLAALAMFVSSMVVILNAWRLYRVQPKTIPVANARAMSRA